MTATIDGSEKTKTKAKAKKKKNYTYRCEREKLRRFIRVWL